MQKIKKSKSEKVFLERERDSSIELFRIISMLVIVAHHYVVNSGLMDLIANAEFSVNRLFLLLFGWGGKIGINCYVLITGYFMCKSSTTLKKFLKILLELEFYNIVIYLIFIITGYTEFSVNGLMKTVLPIYGIGTGFTHSFLVFYLLIPFVNVMIKGINERQHLFLILICVVVYTVIPTFFYINVPLNYVSWFMVIYIIAAYIRCYPKKIFDNRNLWAMLTVITVGLSWIIIYKNGNYYYVFDSNKVLALLIAVSAFLFFKNLNMGYKKVINKIATSTFGVLLIHSNSDSMRRWLWQDVCQNIRFFESKYLILHAIGCVIIIYIICTVIDLLRIRYIEIPFFKWFDKKHTKEIEQ